MEVHQFIGHCHISLSIPDKLYFLGSSRQVLLSVGVAAISAGLAWFRFKQSAEDGEGEKE